MRITDAGRPDGLAGDNEGAPGGAALMAPVEDPPPANPADVNLSRAEIPADLYHVGYVSTQTRPMESEALVDLLTRARERNRECDITGLLLHREDSFFQVMEGAERDVQLLMEKIKRDPRHQRVEILFQGRCAKREFPEWRMGFVELDGVDVNQLPGFTNFLVEGGEPRWMFHELTRTQRLMLLFKTMG